MWDGDYEAPTIKFGQIAYRLSSPDSSRTRRVPYGFPGMPRRRKRAVVSLTPSSAHFIVDLVSVLRDRGGGFLFVQREADCPVENCERERDHHEHVDPVRQDVSGAVAVAAQRANDHL